MSNLKPKWGIIIGQYLLGSLMLLDAMWLMQLHSYTWAAFSALAAILILGSLLRSLL